MQHLTRMMLKIWYKHYSYLFTSHVVLNNNVSLLVDYLSDEKNSRDVHWLWLTVFPACRSLLIMPINIA